MTEVYLVNYQDRNDPDATGIVSVHSVLEPALQCYDEQKRLAPASVKIALLLASLDPPDYDQDWGSSLQVVKSEFGERPPLLNGPASESPNLPTQE